MKTLFINDIDLPGARFNGYDLQQELNRRNIPAKQIVLEKLSNDPNIVSIVNARTRYMETLIRDFESRLSINSIAGYYGRFLMDMPEFIDTDIVHYHLIHNSQISIFDLPELMSRKPSVWTFHDPWAFTGHCIYPIDCNKWKTGCNACPYLDRHFPLQIDNSSEMWKIKQYIYKQLDVDIVVASKWMLDLVRESPLTSHFKRVHLIPFGIDLSIFSQHKDKLKIREKLGIPSDAFVIFFRAEKSEFKGLQYIEDMLDILNFSQKVVLLTVSKKGLLNKHSDKYIIHDHGWVNDAVELSDLYSASDIFLMPSIAEAFGLMAIEAMASGIPVIIFEGTALPSITFAPKCGIALKKGEVQKFAETVEFLMQNESERKRRGDLGVQLAKENYDIQKYNSTFCELYEEIFQRNKINK